MIARTVRRVRAWLGCKRNPLMRDPVYAAYASEEADKRRRHLNAASARKGKTDRLHELLRGAA